MTKQYPMALETFTSCTSSPHTKHICHLQYLIIKKRILHQHHQHNHHGAMAHCCHSQSLCNTQGASCHCTGNIITTCTTNTAKKSLHADIWQNVTKSIYSFSLPSTPTKIERGAASLYWLSLALISSAALSQAWCGCPWLGLAWLSLAWLSAV